MTYGYLEHHGIKNQKWGVRNGPPYPLNYHAHSAAEKRSNPSSVIRNYGDGTPNPKSRLKRAAANAIRTTINKTADHYIKEYQDAVRPIKRGLLETSGFVNSTLSGRNNAIGIGTKRKQGDWTRDPNKKDIKLKKGDSAYRITYGKNEKLSDKPKMYATINENDRNTYKGTFSQIRALGKKKYEKEMEFQRDVKVASKDSQIRAIMKATGKNRDEATQIVGKLNCELVLDDIEHSTETIGMLKQLKQMGYDAVLDLNDSGWYGKAPVVLLNPEDYLSDKNITRVKRKDMNKAIDDVSWDFMGYTKDQIKDFVGNKTGHYTRNQLNTALPKNDADAKKKGWRKLSSKESAMHQFSQHDGVENSKWVSPDGHKEVVFTGKGKKQRITKDVRDIGTYNYYDPQKNPIGHTVKDVVPYVLLGNTADDPTTTYSRVKQSVDNFLHKDEKTKTQEIIRKKKKGK